MFAANAALLVVAAALLVLTPATVSDPISLEEAAIVAGGLVAMVALNLVLVRRTLAPLARLAEAMRNVDLLRPGERIAAEARDREIAELTSAFNDMLGRLEDERRESTRRTFAAQERERLRIARDLHDEIGQGLTAILLQLRRATREADGEERREQLGEAEAAARAGIDEVRRIVRQLRPEALDDLGLVPALAHLVERFANETDVRVERRLARDLPPLGEDEELALYRVAQESLTNVARHAGASKVRIALERAGDSVVLAVDDDGRGMGEARRGGYGIRGMRERAVLVGGRLTIARSELGGVRVALDVPVGDAGRGR